MWARGIPWQEAQFSPVGVHDDVGWGAPLVRCGCGHTGIHKQPKWYMASRVDTGLQVSMVSQLEGGGDLLTTPVIWKAMTGVRD